MRRNLIKYLIIFSIITLPFYSCMSYLNNPAPEIKASSSNSELLLSESAQTIITDNSKPEDNNTHQINSDIALKYVGSTKSNKYHLPSCEWAQKINKSNEIWFSSSEEAKEKGYAPCKVCKPME